MQASTLITPRLAEEAINSRLTCLPIESLPLTQCVGGGRCARISMPSGTPRR